MLPEFQPVMFEHDGHREIVTPLLTPQKILEIVITLSLRINGEYAGTLFTLVCVLNGAMPFFADILRRIKVPGVMMDTIAVSSYDGTESTGRLKMIKDITLSVKGRHVLIVEDIVDTGRTADALTKFMLAKGAVSARVCTLLDKPSRRTVTFQPYLVGAEIGDQFVVGFGLDLNQRFRELPFVGTYRSEPL